ncbi:aminotransferase class I/II-fold pyridoxal phosphate-dependent enzyme [Aureitalea marina]|uniref:Aminotransferase class I/classII large domain-containing protein n=1 Tax=Aureitalea marina TaxID=930804 RepID=A0A2S7KPE6_9FLAO|nr:aminotransferase class I/II-fold pyridoxal phosphate-dependent enzyme [Aureitalea marina]PQB04492.1 hypothetical protein BST85_05940 [Aureitalea marina]
MRSKIFMYLFFFAVLFILFQYMNQKSIFESQQKDIDQLRQQNTALQQQMDSLTDQLAEANYFSLMSNDNAMSYLEGLGFEAADVQQLVAESLYEQNVTPGGHPLIPYEGLDGDLRINKIKFLNHRWIQADFTDGRYWGEMIIEYFYTADNQWDLTPVSWLMYTN